MNKIQFFIPGIPIAKGRPRFFRAGKFVRTYTPKETMVWEHKVKVASVQYRPAAVPQGPCTLDLIFQMPRPKSLPKKVSYHLKRPDLDNMAKAVLDALNGSFYKDDSQIVRMSLEKVYSGTPGVIVVFNQIFDEKGQREPQESLFSQATV